MSPWLIMVIIVALVGVEGREPVLHRVGGGKNTWAPKINLTEWAKHEHFYVGDWLYFGFDKGRYNVLQVNKTSYIKCIDKNFIKNITRGGRDVFNLTEATTYYFISGHGYCFQGIKLEVQVQLAPPDALPPPPMLLPHGGGGGPLRTGYIGLLLHFSLVSSLLLAFCFT